MLCIGLYRWHSSYPLYCHQLFSWAGCGTAPPSATPAASATSSQPRLQTLSFSQPTWSVNTISKTIRMFILAANQTSQTFAQHIPYYFICRSLFWCSLTRAQNIVHCLKVSWYYHTNIAPCVPMPDAGDQTEAETILHLMYPFWGNVNPYYSLYLSESWQLRDGWSDYCVCNKVDTKMPGKKIMSQHNE